MAQLTGMLGFKLIVLKKTDLVCNPNQTLTVGKVNNVRLNVDEDYLPGGDQVGNEPMTITIGYGDTTLTGYYDETLNDYCFDLDLTVKTDNTKVKFTVNVNENKYVNPSSMDVVLPSEYIKISTFSDLINEITLYGTQIIELDSNITLLSRINVNHDLLIYGGDNELDFDGYGFNILNNSTFKLMDCNCINGDSTVIQGIGTKVDLTDCVFSNCESSNYNNLGSVVYCDVNLESLQVVDDFTTNVTNCTFIDNHSCLFCGGETNIINSKLHNTDLNYIDVNNPALIYQTDGTCIITDGVFDITYTSNTLCSNETNIQYAQTLIECGETATINGATWDNLQNDNILPFFDAPYNNRSHIFCKYYYPQISECIFTSPIVGKEDKSICYSCSGVDWIYKENVQVTRASTYDENTDNPIIWEE